MKSKLTSRKFWLSVAAFIGSLASAFAGIQTDNEYVVAVGVICSVLSAGIYAGCEAYVDATAAKKNPDTAESDEPAQGATV